MKEAAAAEKKAEVAQAEVKKAAVNVEKQVKKKKSRFVAVPTEKDERSKGRQEHHDLGYRDPRGRREHGV